jgi:hypothetical protein
MPFTATTFAEEKEKNTFAWGLSKIFESNKQCLATIDFFVKSVLWIRTQIQWGPWIRIQIRIRIPDPGGQK